MMIITVVAKALPPPLRRWLEEKRQRLAKRPPVGWVRFGSLRRLKPVSTTFGFDRGLPIDRYYIEHFLTAHALDIRGRVLEIGDNAYTRKFGGERVARSDVLHVEEGNSQATIIADLTDDNPPLYETFDCIICTQMLQFIYNPRAAIGNLQRMLKPGGILLATFPGISQVSRYDMERWGDYWRFTTLSARRLFEEVFPPQNIELQAHGNVLAATAFLQGLASGELKRNELDYHDPDYQMLITLWAVKPGGET